MAKSSCLVVCEVLLGDQSIVSVGYLWLVVVAAAATAAAYGCDWFNLI